MATLENGTQTNPTGSFLSAVRFALGQHNIEARPLVKAGRLLRIDGWKPNLDHVCQLINTPSGWQIVANSHRHADLKATLVQTARNCGVKLDSLYHKKPA